MSLAARPTPQTPLLPYLWARGRRRTRRPASGTSGSSATAAGTRRVASRRPRRRQGCRRRCERMACRRAWRGRCCAGRLQSQRARTPQTGRIDATTGPHDGVKPSCPAVSPGGPSLATNARRSPCLCARTDQCLALFCQEPALARLCTRAQRRRPRPSLPHRTPQPTALAPGPKLRHPDLPRSASPGPAPTPLTHLPSRLCVRSASPHPLAPPTPEASTRLPPQFLPVCLCLLGSGLFVVVGRSQP
jgi:hypothetical protein